MKFDNSLKFKNKVYEMILNENYSCIDLKEVKHLGCKTIRIGDAIDDIVKSAFQTDLYFIYEEENGEPRLISKDLLFFSHSIIEE